MAADTINKLLTSLAVRLHAFSVCEIKAGWRLMFEAMDAVTIHYVLAGTGTVRVVGGVDRDYAPFSIIVVPARVAQSLGEPDAVEVAVASIDNCGLVADGLVRFTAGDGSRDTLVLCATITASYGGALGVFDELRSPMVEDFSQGDRLRALFATLASEIADPGIGTQAMTESLMKQCLILLLRHHLLRLSVSSPLFAPLEDHRLARAITAVLERPSASYTVDSLASLAGMSRSAFADRFSGALGQTPMEFVQRVRLRLGAELLRSTDLPIKVIAASIGYSGRSYFSRAFRNTHKIDPKSYRAQAAHGQEIAFLATEPSLADEVVSLVSGALDEDD